MRAPSDEHELTVIVGSLGSGEVGSFLTLWNPADAEFGLVESALEWRDSERGAGTSGEVAPWSEPGGALPVGETVNGDIVGYQVGAAEAAWKVLVVDTDLELDPTGVDLDSFLVLWFESDPLVPDSFLANQPEVPVSFVPAFIDVPPEDHSAR